MVSVSQPRRTLEYTMRKFVISLILICLIITFLYLSSVTRIGSPDPYTVKNTSLLAGVDFDKPTADPLFPELSKPTISQSAWLPDWGVAGGIASVEATPAPFYSFSPVWYYLNPDGSVREGKSMVAEMQQLAVRRGAKLIPSIASFKALHIYNAIKPATVDAHVQYLVSEVVNNNFDGIDIDYEEFYYRHKDDFLSFISKLSTVLHEKGKLLSVTVHGDWSSDDFHDTLRHTRTALDWAELNAAADEIRIMAYDFTGHSAQFPGPASPYDWNQAILRYARVNIDPAKTVLALPVYGYDGWSNNLQIPETYLGMNANLPAGRIQADASTYSNYLNRRQSTVSDTLTKDGENLLIYSYAGKNYALTYQNAASIALKLNLSKQYGIKGVAYWRLGQEDIAIYNLINQ